MTPRAAKRIIQAAGARGFDAVEFTLHAARESMIDDGLTAHDVFHLLEHADEVARQPGETEKWKVYGPVLAGEQFAAVVVLVEAERVRVVTVHLPP